MTDEFLTPLCRGKDNRTKKTIEERKADQEKYEARRLKKQQIKELRIQQHLNRMANISTTARIVRNEKARINMAAHAKLLEEHAQAKKAKKLIKAENIANHIERRKREKAEAIARRNHQHVDTIKAIVTDIHNDESLLREIAVIATAMEP
jgi:hypothetical protein